MNSARHSVSQVERAGFHANPSFSVAFDYPVSFTTDVFALDNPTFVDAVSRTEPGKQHKFIVFADQGVLECWPWLSRDIEAYAKDHADRLRLVCDVIAVPGGERCKCDDGLLQRIYQQMLENGIDRHSFIVCVGGGAVLDLVGYAAATAHRGIRLVRMPTTVLGQNDAGIGVKNGINKFGKKNFLGTFQIPFAVINDFAFLKTLGARDRRAGIAEAVKVALIRSEEFFVYLEANRDGLAELDRGSTAYMIRRCAELHLAQIAEGGDPFETGSARPLDYGHWSAHRLEAMGGYELRHGEAVAIGMMIDARYAVLAGVLEQGHEVRIYALLRGLGFDLWDKGLGQTDHAGRLRVLDGLEEFREHLGGRLTVTLPAGIGSAAEVHDMDEQKIRHAIEWLRGRCETA